MILLQTIRVGGKTVHWTVFPRPPYEFPTPRWINTVLNYRRIMTFLHGLAPIDTSKRQLFD